MINLGFRHVFLNQGTKLGVATVQGPGELASAITERSREGSPLADVDWEQFNFGPGLRVT